jgi:hypothetical protein
MFCKRNTVIQKLNQRAEILDRSGVLPDISELVTHNLLATERKPRKKKSPSKMYTNTHHRILPL